MNISEKIQIKENIALAKFTTWKIGGNARFFVDARASEVSEILSWANSNSIKVYILGAGSNVLIKDTGIDGLVLRIKDDTIKILEKSVFVGAGVRLANLVVFLAKNGISGFEFLAGIPGSVGGAIFMNAGIGGDNKREIADIFQSATLYNFNDGTFSVGIDFMNFSHRFSYLQKSGDILLNACFKIEKKSKPNEILENIKDIIKSRLIREPENRCNAGSVFKACNEIPAGLLIDKAGLKGSRIGNAMISLKHANWIENLGGASSDDVELLIKFTKEKVFEKFGMCLEEEVRILG